MTYDIILLIICVVPIVALVITGVILSVLRPFIEDVRYIKLEMKRAQTKSEYSYWKKKLKRLPLMYLFGKE